MQIVLGSGQPTRSVGPLDASFASFLHVEHPQSVVLSCNTAQALAVRSAIPRLVRTNKKLAAKDKTGGAPNA
jgi:hypothetical protein